MKNMTQLNLNLRRQNSRNLRRRKNRNPVHVKNFNLEYRKYLTLGLLPERLTSKPVGVEDTDPLAQNFPLVKSIKRKQHSHISTSNANLKIQIKKTGQRSKITKFQGKKKSHKEKKTHGRNLQVCDKVLDKGKC
jgi:hypothetical protein